MTRIVLHGIPRLPVYIRLLVLCGFFYIGWNCIAIVHAPKLQDDILSKDTLKPVVPNVAPKYGASPTAFDNYIVSEDGSWTDYDVESFMKVKSIPSHFDLARHPRPTLQPQEWFMTVPSSTNRTIESDVLFFTKNRKVGSCMMTQLIGSLARKNDFTYNRIRKHEHPNFPSSLSVDQERDFSTVYLSNNSLARVVSAHVFFIDPSDYGFKRPNYFNMVRHPIDRFVSMFYHLRREQNWKFMPAKPPNAWFEKEFTDCYLRDDPECHFHPGFYREQQLSYFCGNAVECRELGHFGAFQQAKAHLDQYYSVVGVLEELPTSLQVLQAFLPRFFESLPEFYKLRGLKLSGTTEFRTNVQGSYPTVSNVTRAMLAKDIDLEIQFYDFVKSRLFIQLDMIPGK